MKDLYDILNEQMNNTLFHELVQKLEQHHTTNDDDTKQLRDEYMLSELQFTMSRRHQDVINLDMIRSQQQGAGTRFMLALCRFADENHITLTLSPTDKFVGEENINRLINFYRRFGFDDDNKKRLMQLHTKMIRVPQ
jgi:hypothetical protein